MTFELSPQHAAVRDRARGLAQMLADRAVAIDRDGAVPVEITSEIAAVAGGELLSLVLALEEVAAASAAVATTSLARTGARPLTLTGLRGARQLEATASTYLGLAAVALGIGSAALQAGLAELRRSTAVAGADVEKPHWVIADVATDLEASRLLVYKAARTANDADIALARLMASAAANRAVDAAVRVIGQDALRAGHLIERLTRDVKAVLVLAGTEEDQRAMAAEGLLPH